MHKSLDYKVSHTLEYSNNYRTTRILSLQMELPCILTESMCNRYKMLQKACHNNLPQRLLWAAIRRLRIQQL